MHWYRSSYLIRYPVVSCEMGYLLGVGMRWYSESPAMSDNQHTRDVEQLKSTSYFEVAIIVISNETGTVVLLVLKDSFSK